MPTITLVAVPSQGASAYDPTSDTHLLLGQPTEVDEGVYERLASLEPLGYRFTTDEVPADSAAPDPAAEQAADPPAEPQES